MTKKQSIQHPGFTVLEPLVSRDGRFNFNQTLEGRLLKEFPTATASVFQKCLHWKLSPPCNNVERLSLIRDY